MLSATFLLFFKYYYIRDGAGGARGGAVG